MKRLYNEDIQSQIVLRMWIASSKGDKEGEAQLGIYHNLVPELLIGDRKQANQMWNVVCNLHKAAGVGTKQRSSPADTDSRMDATNKAVGENMEASRKNPT